MDADGLQTWIEGDEDADMPGKAETKFYKTKFCKT